jgi:hypothetical protein
MPQRRRRHSRCRRWSRSALSGGRTVVARTAGKGAAYVGNLDVDDRLVSDKADNWDAAVREIADALGERVECRPGAQGVNRAAMRLRVTEMKLLKTPLAPHSRMLVALWRGDRWVVAPTRNQRGSKAGHPRSMFGPTINGDAVRIVGTRDRHFPSGPRADRIAASACGVNGVISSCR